MMRISRYASRPLVGAIAALVLLGVAMADVSADPAADALAKLNELSRQAEQATEAVHSGQLDLKAKLAAQQDVDRRHAADRAAAELARAELTTYQAAVDQVAATTYMGGRTDGFSAVMNADSPQQLIDQLSVQRVMADQMSNQMAAFRTANERAVQAADASAKSAAEARTAAEQAAAVSAQLQARQSQLQTQIASVEAQYEALTPDQRTALADPGPPPPPLPDSGGPPPTDPAIIAMPGEPPADVSPPAVDSGPSAAAGGAAVVQAALTRVGSPYSWGGSGPHAFDCSGLIMWAFQQTGKSLPHSSQALASGGQSVPVSELQAGDIVTFYSDASHAGIYVGDGMMVHASTYGTPVRVAPIASTPIHNARRY